MTEKQPVYIIADDLTGAADAANYFRTSSHRVRVSFQPETPWAVSLDANVVQVFDSETRGSDEETEVQRITVAAEKLAATGSGSFHIFKKVDSTLRGHIGSEIERLLGGIKRRIALLAPSFPANGRTVENDVLLVDGVPISQTAFARDPRTPVTVDRVSEIVRQTTNLPILSMSREIVRRGSDAIIAFIENIHLEQAILVVDAEVDADLANIAEAVANRSEILPCGSAGLAKQLATLWVNDGVDGRVPADLNSHVSTEKKPQALKNSRSWVPLCDHVLIAVGSANPVAHAQLAVVTDVLGAPVVTLDPVLLATGNTHVKEIEQARTELIKRSSEAVMGVILSEKRAQRDPGLPGSFENDLAGVSCHWAHSVTARHPSHTIGFVATGGDTALALCEALNASAIWPEGEVVAGMPWSWIETPHGNIPMISKAGGFGNPDALEVAASYLMNKNVRA